MSARKRKLIVSWKSMVWNSEEGAEKGPPRFLCDPLCASTSAFNAGVNEVQARSPPGWGPAGISNPLHLLHSSAWSPRHSDVISALRAGSQPSLERFTPINTRASPLAPQDPDGESRGCSAPCKDMEGGARGVS